MAVLDAWSYGLPVVTTLVGGLPDIIVHEKNAMVFDPGNILQLSIQLKKVISDKILMEKLSQESSILAVSLFEESNIDKKLDDLYTMLLKDHNTN